jgi:hypothetical protein
MQCLVRQAPAWGALLVAAIALLGNRNDRGIDHLAATRNVALYLREITGKDITTKDFRTWAGTATKMRKAPGRQLDRPHPFAGQKNNLRPPHDLLRRVAISHQSLKPPSIFRTNPIRAEH